MIRAVITPAGAYFNEHGAIDFVWFCFGGNGEPLVRLARYLKVDSSKIQLVGSYCDLR